MSQNILIVRMIHAKSPTPLKKSTVYPAWLRDLNRLQSLQNLFPQATIYTMNLFPVTGIEVQPTHCFASLSRRGAKTLMKQFPGVIWNMILLDYFRFPTVYMREACLSVFSAFSRHLSQVSSTFCPSGNLYSLQRSLGGQIEVESRENES